MLKVYNTLSAKKEAFKPKNGRKVSLFVCGPTVYDSAHIGHARTYLFFDMVAKYLKEKEYSVFYLQNITNIDDKIINRAKETRTAPSKLAAVFEKDYLKDMKALKITGVNKYARATDYIKEIVSQAKRLLKKGYAYQIADGVYYDISKFKDYGKLSRRTVLRAEDAVSRIDENVKKRNKGDFCLWKISKPGEPAWPSPWGKGRPGWHIEDTAITEKFFGPQYDIHGGGVDLIFPHHEAEIAQMEAISGKKPLVKHWLHTGFLTVNGQKMSKSLGNFITIKDFINKKSARPLGARLAPPNGGAARVLRFLLLKNHYRSPIDYSESAVLQAEKELERIDEFLSKLTSIGSVEVKLQPRLKFNFNRSVKKFGKDMDDDFNTPKAIAVIFELIRQRDSLNAKEVLKFLKQTDKFFNFIFWPKKEKNTPIDVLRLAKQREKYREQKEWQKADEIREKIKKIGFLIEDTADGPKIKRLNG